MSRAVSGALLSLCLLAVAACDETPTGPTTPEVPVVTESFSGTVTVNGAVTHSFIVGTPAGVTATLTSVSPSAETPMGLSLGTYNTATGTCTIVIANDNALQGLQLVGSATTSGAFCVRVYDVGKLTAPNSYEVTVAHK